MSYGIISVALETHIQKTLVGAFKSFFKTKDDFPYDDDPALTRLHILGDYGKRSVRYPCILIGQISGDPMIRTFGTQRQETLTGTRTIDDIEVPNVVCGYVRGGGHKVSIPIYFLSMSQAEIRIMKDYTNTYLSIIGRDYLQSKNINLISLQASAMDAIVLGNEIVKRSLITATMFTEWYETIYDVDLISDVNVIGISETIT